RRARLLRPRHAAPHHRPGGARARQGRGDRPRRRHRLRPPRRRPGRRRRIPAPARRTRLPRSPVHRTPPPPPPAPARRRNRPRPRRRPGLHRLRPPPGTPPGADLAGGGGRMTPAPPPAALSAADRELLLHLLGLPTTGTLAKGTHGPPPQLREAQAAYAAAAAEDGFIVLHHAPADPADLDRPDVPAPVREALADPDFLALQPSLVLRLGPGLPAERTVMFNVHLDTVAGELPVGFDGERFRGRGAIDAKGPAVALLAGVRAARRRSPALGRDTGVLIQAVSG